MGITSERLPVRSVEAVTEHLPQVGVNLSSPFPVPQSLESPRGRQAEKRMGNGDQENRPSSSLCQDLFVAVMGVFGWGPFIFPFKSKPFVLVLPAERLFPAPSHGNCAGASRPRLVPIIPSIDSNGNLGFVHSPSPRTHTLSH